MNSTRPVHRSSLIVHRSSFAGRPRLPPRNGLLHHVLVDGDRAGAGGGGVELDVANHAPERLAQRAGAEALLVRGVPGDGDESAARDLQIDAEALEVGARSAE